MLIGKKGERFGPTGNMPVCCFVPPHALESIAVNSSGPDGQAARWTLMDTAKLNGQREILSFIRAFEAVPGGLQRTTYDALESDRLPGIARRREGETSCGMQDADHAHDYAGLVYQMLYNIFNRDSLDGNGQRLISTVKYGRRFCNAYWNGRQMVYGTGDGDMFGDFTTSLSVVGHELTHGMIQAACGLIYQGEPGAVNEHMADVFGTVCEMFVMQKASADYDWVVGRGLFTPRVQGSGVRNMLHPGTAYDDPRMGKDPQPDRYSNLIRTSQDNGGVHLNSGILNRAFALAAIAIGGNAWENVAPVWYRCLTKHLTPMSDFDDLADGTIAAARYLYGVGGKEEHAIRGAWDAVEIKPKI